MSFVMVHTLEPLREALRDATDQALAAAAEAFVDEANSKVGLLGSARGVTFQSERRSGDEWIIEVVGKSIQEIPVETQNVGGAVGGVPAVGPRAMARQMAQTGRVVIPVRVHGEISTEKAKMSPETVLAAIGATPFEDALYAYAQGYMENVKMKSEIAGDWWTDKTKRLK